MCSETALFYISIRSHEKTTMIQDIKARILAGGEITEEEALALLTTPHKEELYQAAHEITEHFMGKAFDTCSIINAKSGNCPRGL